LPTHRSNLRSSQLGGDGRIKVYYPEDDEEEWLPEIYVKGAMEGGEEEGAGEGEEDEGGIEVRIGKHAPKI
jgi:hypothetical protein